MLYGKACRMIMQNAVKISSSVIIVSVSHQDSSATVQIVVKTGLMN